MMFFLDEVEGDGTVTVVQQIVHRDAVMVEVEMWLETECYSTVGVARRHPTDKFSREIGLKLAYARALKQLAAKLDKQVMGQQKHLEDVAAQKKIQKNRQKWTGILAPKKRVDDPLYFSYWNQPWK